MKNSKQINRDIAERLKEAGFIQAGRGLNAYFRVVVFGVMDAADEDHLEQKISFSTKNGETTFVCKIERGLFGSAVETVTFSSIEAALNFFEPALKTAANVDEFLAAMLEDDDTPTPPDGGLVDIDEALSHEELEIIKKVRAAGFRFNPEVGLIDTYEFYPDFNTVLRIFWSPQLFYWNCFDINKAVRLGGGYGYTVDEVISSALAFSDRVNKLSTQSSEISEKLKRYGFKQSEHDSQIFSKRTKCMISESVSSFRDMEVRFHTIDGKTTFECEYTFAVDQKTVKGVFHSFIDAMGFFEYAPAPSLEADFSFEKKVDVSQQIDLPWTLAEAAALEADGWTSNLPSHVWDISWSEQDCHGFIEFLPGMSNSFIKWRYVHPDRDGNGREKWGFADTIYEAMGEVYYTQEKDFKEYVDNDDMLSAERKQQSSPLLLIVSFFLIGLFGLPFVYSVLNNIITTKHLSSCISEKYIQSSANSIISGLSIAEKERMLADCKAINIKEGK